MNLKRTILIFSILFLIQDVRVNAQIVVETGVLTPTEYVNDILVGTGVKVSNVTFNGETWQIGSFSGNSNIGFDGLVIVTGDVNAITGPNDEQGSTSFAGGEGQEEDLKSLAGVDPIFGEPIFYDIGTLEFDFIPSGDSIAFDFVFASEEYIEFVGQIWNDVFGFFLSGPGINGPYLNNAINLGTVPGTDIPISINTIHGTDGDILPLNEEYYRDFGGETVGPPPPPYSTDPFYTEFDGMTTVLTAKAAVECGETYHIKLTITDVNDEEKDAAIFFKANEFRTIGGAVQVTKTTPTGSDTITEGESATFTFNRTADDISAPLTIAYEIKGTATNGTDYDLIVVDSVTFPAGVATRSININSKADFPTEGAETVIVTVKSETSCGATATSNNTLYIKDGEEQPMSIVTAPDVITPNEDGMNDALVFPGLSVEEFPDNLLEIFNRWGRRVHEEKGYNNDWSPKELSDGTYYYVLQVGNSESTELKGSFTILK